METNKSQNNVNYSGQSKSTQTGFKALASKITGPKLVQPAPSSSAVEQPKVDVDFTSKGELIGVFNYNHVGQYNKWEQICSLMSKFVFRLGLRYDFNYWVRNDDGFLVITAYKVTDKSQFVSDSTDLNKIVKENDWTGLTVCLNHILAGLGVQHRCLLRLNGQNIEVII